MDAGGVYEDDLGLVGGEDAFEAVAGGLGSGGGDGDFLADEGVHQGGFANVRPSDNADEARSEALGRNGHSADAIVDF